MGRKMSDREEDSPRNFLDDVPPPPPPDEAPLPRRVIVDLGSGPSLWTPLGESARHFAGEIFGDILVCDSPKGRFGIHLPSSRVVYFEGEGFATPPPGAARALRRQAARPAKGGA